MKDILKSKYCTNQPAFLSGKAVPYNPYSSTKGDVYKPRGQNVDQFWPPPFPRVNTFTK